MGNNNNYNPFQNTFYQDLIKEQAGKVNKGQVKIQEKGRVKTKVNNTKKKGIYRHG